MQLGFPLSLLLAWYAEYLATKQYAHAVNRAMQRSERVYNLFRVMG